MQKEHLDLTKKSSEENKKEDFFVNEIFLSKTTDRENLTFVCTHQHVMIYQSN